MAKKKKWKLALAASSRCDLLELCRRRIIELNQTLFHMLNHMMCRGDPQVEVAFDGFAADCAARPECTLRFGGDIRAAFDRAVEQVAATPLVYTRTGETMNESLIGWYVANLLLSLPDSGSSIEQFIEDALVGNGQSGGAVLGSVKAIAELTVPAHCADFGFSDLVMVKRALARAARGRSSLRACRIVYGLALRILAHRAATATSRPCGGW